MSSVNFYDGVRYPSVLRGRLLSESWIAVKSSRLTMLRSVFFGRY